MSTPPIGSDPSHGLPNYGATPLPRPLGAPQPVATPNPSGAPPGVQELLGEDGFVVDVAFEEISQIPHGKATVTELPHPQLHSFIRGGGEGQIYQSSYQTIMEKHGNQIRTSYGQIEHELQSNMGGKILVSVWPLSSRIDYTETKDGPIQSLFVEEDNPEHAVLNAKMKELRKVYRDEGWKTESWPTVHRHEIGNRNGGMGLEPPAGIGSTVKLTGMVLNNLVSDIDKRGDEVSVKARLVNRKYNELTHLIREQLTEWLNEPAAPDDKEAPARRAAYETILTNLDRNTFAVNSFILLSDLPRKQFCDKMAELIKTTPHYQDIAADLFHKMREYGSKGTAWLEPVHLNIAPPDDIFPADNPYIADIYNLRFSQILDTNLARKELREECQKNKVPVHQDTLEGILLRMVALEDANEKDQINGLLESPALTQTLFNGLDKTRKEELQDVIKQHFGI